MQINPSEVTKILKEQIKKFGKKAEVSEVGQVLSVGDGIVRVYGLDNVQAGEMVEFAAGVKGMALNLVSINKGELKAKLISSKELSVEEQEKIQSELSKDFKSSLIVDYKYDPNLIAGLIIQVGSVMVDTSIRTKLKKLEKNMVEAWYAN